MAFSCQRSQGGREDRQPDRASCAWQSRRCEAGWRRHQRNADFLRPGLPRLFQANRQGNRSAVVWRGQGNAGQRYQASKAHRRGTMKGYQMAKTSKFDAADYLKTPAAIAAYLTEAFETDDAAYIRTALDTVARAKGIANVAKATGLGRESLYKAFSGASKPEFDTVRKVMGSFGVKLVAEPIEE